MGRRSFIRGLKALDLIAVALSLTVTLVLAVRVYGAGAAPKDSTVLVEAPSGKWIYPLSKDRVISDVGPAGYCVISIQAGSVRVLSSDCPQMICILSGSIARAGEWIACLPHQVFIRVSGTPRADGSSPDAVAF